MLVKNTKNYLLYLNRLLHKFLFLIILLSLWQFMAVKGYINTHILPSPSQLCFTSIEMLQTGELLKNVVYSIQRVIIGFSIASLTGISFGLLLGTSRILKKFFYFYIELLRPIPPIAWIPLAILWFGIGDIPAYFIVSLGAFFPIFVNSFNGLQSVHPSYIQAARSLGANFSLILTDVMLPAALPYIMVGLRIGLGVAWTSVIAAELVGAQSGLGYMIQTNRIILRTDKILVGMIVIGFVGYVMNYGMSTLESRFLCWQEKDENG